MQPKAIRELLAYIFGDTDAPLSLQFAAWLDASPRFQAFAETYRDKIRKKVRLARDAAGRDSLASELETAYTLLLDRRFTVEYEPYAIGAARGPDFGVTFKAHIRFDVEVTRIQPASEDAAPDVPQKLAGTLCDKLGQFQPAVPNVLILAPRDMELSTADVAQAMRLLAQRATRKDDEFFTRRGLAGARDYQQRVPRLSAILVGPAGNPQAATWTNPGARHPLPAAVLRALAPAARAAPGV